jgi:ribosomal-protein-alanine N-acetyltransferase
MKKHVLHTERLLLRPLESKDAVAVHRLASAAEIADTTLTIPHPYPFHAAVEWIDRGHKEWKAETAFIFAITLRESKDLIGGIGLHLNNHDRNAEMGFWIGKPYWNQGFCSEAGRVMLQFGFETLGLHRIFARHFPRNAASSKVIAKLGMKYEGHLREHVRKLDRFEDVVCYGILQSEWK